MPRKKKYPKLPNGVGSISVLKGNRRKKYLARKAGIQLPDGSYYRKSIGTFETYMEAYNALTNPESVINDKSTSYEIFKAWTNTNSFKKLADVTKNKYIWGIKKFAPLIYLPIANTSYAMWQERLDQIENEGYIVETEEGIEERFYSKSSVTKMKNAVIKTFKYALKNDIVKQNIGYMLEYIAVDGQNATNPFTLQQLDQINSLAKKHRFAKIIMVNNYTGLRPAEMCNLEKDHINFDEGYIKGMGVKSLAGKNRKVPIHPKIEKYLRELYLSTDKYIVGKPMGYNDFRKDIFVPVLEYLNLEGEYTPYACRKTCAFLLNHYGVDKEVIKQIMGHAKYETTSDNYIVEDIVRSISEFNKIA